MRVLGTFMTILILGIFGCTIARKRIPIKRELTHGQSKLSDIPTEFFEAILGNLDISLRRKCEENGRPMAYDAFRRDLRSLPNCIDSALNIEQLEAHRQHALYYREWRTFFEEYCPKVPAAKLCFNHRMDSAKPCLDTEEQKEIEIFNSATNSILEFLCQDSGSNIAHFVAIGGVECVASRQEALLVCVTIALETYPRPGERKNFPSYTLSPEDCADLEKVRNCTVKVMQTCDDPRAANLVESVFDFYKRERSCKVIPEEPTNTTEEIWISTTTSQEFVPSTDETPWNFVKEQCDENGGPTAYKTFNESAELVLDAYGLVFNSSQINAEISTAPPGEELVDVCKKYCRRAPILKGLIKYAGDSMKHCLKPEDRNGVDIIYKIKSSILEFVCHNEGERISTFVATGGIECLGSEGEALLYCASQSFGGYSPSIFSVGAPALGLDNLEVPFVQGAKFCADVDKFRDCSIEVLGRCGDRTTNLNFLNLAVDLISKEIPCGNLLEQTEPPTPEILNSPSDLNNITGWSDIHTMRTVSNEAFNQFLAEKCAPDYKPTRHDVATVMPYYLSKSIQLMLENLVLINFESIDVGERDELNLLFKKFCRNVSTVEERMQVVVGLVGTCPYLRDRKKMDFLLNATSAFQEFVCHNDGERLARLAATGGIECWASLKGSIESRVIDYFPNNLDTSTSYVPSGSSFNKCQYYTSAAKMCFVSPLEDCRDRTPVNIIDSLIDHVTGAVPCTSLLNP